MLQIICAQFGESKGRPTEVSIDPPAGATELSISKLCSTLAMLGLKLDRRVALLAKRSDLLVFGRLDDPSLWKTDKEFDVAYHKAISICLFIFGCITEEQQKRMELDSPDSKSPTFLVPTDSQLDSRKKELRFLFHPDQGARRFCKENLISNTSDWIPVLKPTLEKAFKAFQTAETILREWLQSLRESGSMALSDEGNCDAMPTLLIEYRFNPVAPGAAGGEQVDAVAHQVDSQMDTGHPNNPGPGGEGDRHPTAHHVDSIDNDSRDPNVDLQMDIGHPKNPGPGGGGDRHPAAHHVRAPVIDVTEGPDPPPRTAFSKCERPLVSEHNPFCHCLNGEVMNSRFESVMDFVHKSLGTVFPENVSDATQKEVCDRLIYTILKEHCPWEEGGLLSDGVLKTLKHGGGMHSEILDWFLHGLCDACGVLCVTEGSPAILYTDNARDLFGATAKSDIVVVWGVQLVEKLRQCSSDKEMANLVRRDFIQNIFRGRQLCLFIQGDTTHYMNGAMYLPVPAQAALLKMLGSVCRGDAQ